MGAWPPDPEVPPRCLLGGTGRGEGGGRHVYWPPGDCCLPADAPLPCSPTSKLVTLYIFLLRVSVYLCLPSRSPDSHESHLYFSLWRKSVSLRSKSDFSAPLPEQNDAVCDYFYRRRGVIQYLYWSIMIYITLYGQTRFSKRGHSLAQLTQHIEYEAALSRTERKSHNSCPSLFSVFTFLLLLQGVHQKFFSLDTTRPPSSFSCSSPA